MIKKNGKSVSLNVGVKIFAFTSKNQMIFQKKEYLLEKNIKKMLKVQKSLSSKKKGSKNTPKNKKLRR